MSQKLFTPLTIGSATLKNRIALAPLTRARSGKDRVPNDLMAEYYKQRSSAGLIISEATTISSQGNGWNESPGIYSEEMAEGWKNIVEQVHEVGGLMFLQLWHCGRASHSDFHDGDLPVSASAIKLNGDEIHTPKGKKSYEEPRPLSLDEISTLKNDYKLASQRAKNAGFDGVEIHSANGYLLDQFLQSKTNVRDDEYGGSIANRSRLLLEIVEEIASVFDSKKIAVRLSPNGSFNDMGSDDYREQFSYVVSELDNFDLGYLHIIDGLGFGFHELGDPMTLAEFRKIYSGTIMGNCGYTKESAEEAITAGNADLIAFGRPYISNPDLVERFKEGIELNPEADQSVWYTPGGEEGYTDFPKASLSNT